MGKKKKEKKRKPKWKPIKSIFARICQAKFSNYMIYKIIKIPSIAIRVTNSGIISI